MTRVDELRHRIEEAQSSLSKLAEGSGTAQIKIPALMSRHHADISSAVAEMAEISTRRVIKLTWWLVVLTGSLLFLTLVLAIFTIALYKDTHFQIQREKQQGHARLQPAELPP